VVGAIAAHATPMGEPVAVASAEAFPLPHAASWFVFFSPSEYPYFEMIFLSI